VRDLQLPADFERRIVDVFGDAGRMWIGDLPALLETCTRRWALTIGDPFALSYNYVAPVTREDGTEAVLKAGVPRRAFDLEIAALRLYDGRGAVRLIDSDRTEGVMLLERVHPGTMLSEAVADDEEATRAGAAVMLRLWHRLPPEHQFPSVGEWAEALPQVRAMCDGGTGPLPERIFELGESLFVELLASQEEPVLLHGDLHHYNILRSERDGWIAIDPQGVAGERGFELGAFLRNPMTSWPREERRGWEWQPDAGERLRRRVAVFSEALNLPAGRIVAWGIAVSVLSACWSLEGHGRGWEPAMRVAELLASEL
jgi:streptomycin 6-kinase